MTKVDYKKRLGRIRADNRLIFESKKEFEDQLYLDYAKEVYIPVLLTLDLKPSEKIIIERIGRGEKGKDLIRGIKKIHKKYQEKILEKIREHREKEKLKKEKEAAEASKRLFEIERSFHQTPKEIRFKYDDNIFVFTVRHDYSRHLPSFVDAKIIDAIITREAKINKEPAEDWKEKTNTIISEPTTEEFIKYTTEITGCLANVLKPPDDPREALKFWESTPISLRHAIFDKLIRELSITKKRIEEDLNLAQTIEFKVIRKISEALSWRPAKVIKYKYQPDIRVLYMHYFLGELQKIREIKKMEEENEKIKRKMR